MSGAPLIPIAGCLFFQSGDNDDNGPESLNEDTETERPEKVCTDAHITRVTWEGKESGSSWCPVVFNNQWIYYVDFENKGVVPGDIVVELTFWRSRAKEDPVGDIKRKISIDSVEDKTRVIKIRPPSDECWWTTVRVSQEDCQSR